MLIEFCLPVYNEEKILEKNIVKLLKYCQAKNFDFDWRIVIINNGSTDNSSNVCHKLIEKYDKIGYSRITNPGRGMALKEYWLLSKADIVAYMDIDIAVSLENISDLINPLASSEADLVIGSRLMRGSSIERSFIREVVSRGCNIFYRLIMGHRISDTQCGFKAMKTGIFRKISGNIRDAKWFFDTEIIFFTHFFGYKIKEIPVNWEENRYDERKSKVSLMKDSIIHFNNLLKLKKRVKKMRV